MSSTEQIRQMCSKYEQNITFSSRPAACGGLWLDCRKITESGRQFVKFIRKTSGLYVSGGNQYGRGGEGFLRVNVATSKLVVEDGMQRLYESVDAWLKEERISK